MENRFSNVFLACCAFPLKILEYPHIANCPQALQHRFAVSADVSRVCDIVYKEQRSWAGVNRTMLRIYGAEPYQLDPTYPPREEPVQKEERSAYTYF